MGENGPPVPGVQLAGQAPDRVPAKCAAVPGPEPLELVPVAAHECRERLGEITRLDERAVDLGHRARERVREPGMPPARSLRIVHDATEDEVSLCLAEQPSRAAAFRCEGFEQRVERADRSGQEAVAAPDELALSAIDLCAVRDDQPGIAVELLDEPVEQERDLAGMNPGFAGIDNELYLDPRTTMLFGDAKDSVVKLIGAVKAQ